MKKISILLFVAASSFFISCEKDSDDTPQSVAVEQESLLATWEVTGYQVEDGKTITSVDGQSLTQNYTAIGKDYDMTVTFNDVPKTVVSNGSYTVVLTTTVLGQTSTQEAPAFSAFEASEWKLDGSDIVLVNDEIETKVIISELTDDKMVMVMNINENTVVDEASNAKITTTGKLTITLEK